MSNIINVTKQNISLITDSLLDIITTPNNKIENSNYYYKYNERKYFLVYLYLFKLMLNKEDYIIKKYNEYLKLLNINEEQINLDKLLNIRKELLNNNYYYNKNNESIYFSNDLVVDTKELIPLIILLLDNTKDTNTIKEINICYTIPNKNIKELTKLNDIDDYLNEYNYYNINIKHSDKTKLVKENNILILKNAAINYLKHLKQYKHDYESKETYKIFYNLLNNECHKQGFNLSEEEYPLIEAEESKINLIKNTIDKEFITLPLTKQTHLIENIIWQSSNDINLLEQINSSIDSCIDLITLLYEEDKKETYKSIKDYHTIKDIQIIEILLVSKFINIYLNPEDNLDYSLLNLNDLKPKYMSIICDEEEKDIKNRIKQLDASLNKNKRDLEQYKKERSNINKEELKDKYNKELERCVSNINQTSIAIGTINSKLSTLTKRYEEIKLEQKNKYKNIQLYNYNRSIIKHICNSILACSFYLKTSNNTDLLNNIIIFEDYENTENAFYMEISFKNLIKISKNNLITSIIEQKDLPKLMSDEDE